VEIKNGSDDEQFSSIRRQFFQSLVDNLEQRFAQVSFMQDASCLNLKTWPKEPLEKALYGDKSVADWCKQSQFGGDESAAIIIDYGLCKQSIGTVVESQLQKLTSLLMMLPVSAADSERGFSQMNLFHTSGRNRLMVHNGSNLMMVGINGPPLAYWNAEIYVISWLQSGRHGALDKATSLPRKQQTLEHRSKLLSLTVCVLGVWFLPRCM